eukprot:5479804-Pyramimonas_sp.AAC.1
MGIYKRNQRLLSAWHSVHPCGKLAGGGGSVAFRPSRHRALVVGQGPLVGCLWGSLGRPLGSLL